MRQAADQRNVLVGLLIGAICFLAGCGESQNPLSDLDKSEAHKQLVGVWRLIEMADYTKSSDVVPKTEIGILVIGKMEEEQLKSYCERDGLVVPKFKKFPPGMMRGTFSGLNGDGISQDGGSFCFIPSQIAGKSYANLIHLPTESKVPRGPEPIKLGKREIRIEVKPALPQAEAPRSVAPRYDFIRYEVRNGRMRAWLMDPKGLEKAIAEKKIAATVSKGFLKISTITESTENLNKLLQNGGDELLFPTEQKPLFVLERVNLD